MAISPKQVESRKKREFGVEVDGNALIEPIVVTLAHLAIAYTSATLLIFFPPITSKLPIQAEVVLTGVLIGVFLAISYQKKHDIASK